MSITNKQLVSKADLALADLTSNGGRLNPEQTNRFIRKMIDSPTILRRVRTVGMTNQQMKINKLWFANPILKPATWTAGARALAASDRAAPASEQIQLSTEELIAEVRIPYEVLEDNIEGGSVSGANEAPAGGLHQTIIDLIGERVALDLEYLLIQGDSAGSGGIFATYPYLTKADGYLKRITSNVVNANSATYSKDVVKSVVKAMPDKYLRDRAQMVHFVSVDNETELRDTYGNRQTAMGDQHVQGNLPLYVFGSKVEGAALMPAANSIYCNPLNLIFGVQRNVMMEFDKIISERVYQIVVTMRVATQIEEETAAVKVTGIA